jgi:hypothetical protein
VGVDRFSNNTLARSSWASWIMSIHSSAPCCSATASAGRHCAFSPRGGQHRTKRAGKAIARKRRARVRWHPCGGGFRGHRALRSALSWELAPLLPRTTARHTLGTAYRKRAAVTGDKRLVFGFRQA